MTTIIRCAAAALLAMSASWAGAQNFPTKSLRMIIHFPPGGPTDFVGRALAQKLSEAWKQQIIVENRPGASGIIGIETVLRAPADGYTLLFGTGGSLALAPALNSKLPYNVFTDLAPITLAAWGTLLVAAHPSVPYASVAELIAAAKAYPGKLNYGSPGVGTPHHLAMELFKNVAAINVVHIPYKGTAGAVSDLLGGQIHLMFLPIHVALPQVRAGKLKALAVGSPQRSALAPELPTLAEGGFPGVESDIWYAFFAPQGTPREIISRLNAELKTLLALPEIRKSFQAQGLEPVSSTPEDVRALVEKDLAKWDRVVREAKISPE